MRKSLFAWSQRSPQEEHNITYTDRGEKPETNHEDSKTNPNYGTFYEYGPVFFFFETKKNCCERQRLRNCSRIKATKEKGLLIVLYNPGWLWIEE